MHQQHGLRLIWYMILYSCLAACGHKATEVHEGLPALLFKVDANINLYDSSGNEGLVLRLYPDGQYAHYAVRFYNYGTWQWDSIKRRVTLKPATGKPYLSERTYQINEMKEGLDKSFTMQHVFYNAAEGKVHVEKNAHPILVANQSSKLDPFAASMNRWRIAPTAPETKAQIKERTIAYLTFVKALHEYALEQAFDVFSYGWYPAPVQMHYANGARMSYADELDDWYACFYNQEQGIEAYKLLSGVIRKTKLKALPTKAERNIDYAQQFIDLVQQLPTSE